MSPFGEVGAQARIAADGSDRHEITKHLPVLPAWQLSTFRSNFTKATRFDIHNVYPGSRQAPVAPHACSVRHYGVPPVEQYINLADLDQTKKQRHYAQKMAKVLHILASSSQFLHVFVENIGFTMHEIRMSGDLRVAYIRWSVYKGCPVDMEQRLKASKGRLRTAVGKMLQMKHTPDLQFRRDKLKNHRQEMEAAIRQLQMEDESELEHEDTSDDSNSDADGDAYSNSDEDSDVGETTKEEDEELVEVTVLEEQEEEKEKMRNNIASKNIVNENATVS
eukprot:CAMPEP_0198199074 /NCGR_PEP_ID=MMETSP1445-20131203/2406_1 /TAXON_ID=36898 /ORGANISM="Pyramimonas sp., Strain CCMP2087" /LENGTH=277 /DNA_ID=CAMNT_0043868791 /DNA_START=451 /DNA_END=1284 /DNA_ORIENTATION=+